MKKYLLPPVLLLCGIFLLQSCKKGGHDTKYITLNETINSGSTYSLNPLIYGDDDDVASITTQAVNYTKSQFDIDAAGKNIYHFSTGSKVQDKETVVITLTENHDGRGGNNCNKTEAVITINFTVQ